MARVPKKGKTAKAAKSKARKASPAKGRSPAKVRRGVAARQPKARSVEAQLALKTAELHDALAQQLATAEVLQVISGSSGDLALVFDTMLDKAMHLCGAQFGVLAAYDGKTFRTAAARGLPDKYAAHRRRSTGDYGPGTAPFRHLQGEAVVHIVDLKDSDAYRAGEPNRRALVDLAGARCLLCVPLLSDRRVIGCVMIFRQQARPFGDRQIALLKYFAAQAVIAIENARLFDEVESKSRQLSEALQQQTATAEVLQVTSNSPGELGPVFRAVLENATRICDARFGTLLRFDGTAFHFAADVGTPAALAEYVRRPGPFQGLPGGMIDRIFTTRQMQHTPDYAADPTPGLAARLGGARSALGVPILKDGTLVGAIVIYRQEVRPFSDREIELVRVFAAQAAIAIENARLFNETREALERQTATADILKVIASSPSDVQPVFEAIAERSKRLVDALSTTVFRLEDGIMHLRAFTPTSPEADAALKAMFPVPLSTFSWSGAIGKGEIFRVEDTEHEIANLRDLARQRGFRSMLFIPLLSDRKPIGIIAVTRVEPGPFVEHHVLLLQTFAAQAVIAIENVRLFDEVQAKTRDLSEALEQQTATSEVLAVISRSPSDLNPVLEAISDTAARLCGSEQTMFFRYDGAVFRILASWNFPPDVHEMLERRPLMPGHPSAIGRAGASLKPVCIPDVLADPNYGLTGEQSRARYRATLAVPLLRDGQLIGALSLNRSQPGAFTEKQIDLVATFADQAVIAISNVNLFRQVQERTRELSRSLDDLRTAQDRLVQTEKLASLGQLTAGIAHEIKNPLNFVNNFSALSVELIDEMADVFENPALDEAGRRKELDEIRGLLKSNLEKVVQHGKRADSIVKNMLLHSREGAGERRPADINALLDESLNLAYHGARAERPDFNITLQRYFDPDAGAIDAFPQEITRAFLNLISNGFYAASLHRAGNGKLDFEPVLSAATKNLGNEVEIRIRDNGTGIPPDVKEKIFNPFFTTKPPGEGTGLGLSMSHDIIVKQHGGRIEVETEPGRFTEFKIVLPRASQM